MENEKTSEKSIFQVDTLEIVKILNRSRKVILKFAIVFLVLGLLVAFLLPKEYSSSSVFVSQISSSKKLGKKISGIASLIGVNVGESGTDVILPMQYPLIVESTPFKKQLLESKIPVNERDSLVTVSYYLENLRKPGVLSTVKGYTIGLPGKIIKLFKSSEEGKPLKKRDSSAYYLTLKEKQQLDYLYSNFSVNINDVDGYIEIKTTFPEAEASARLTNNIQNLLQEFIIEYNIKKARQELKYISERFEETEEDYFNKRATLASYKDRNINVISNRAQNRLEQLQTEYNLSSNIYSQIAGELETAKLNVKKDTPVFTIIKPATIPLEESFPKKPLILIQFLLVGLILGSLYILFRHFYPEIKKKITN
ncbi:hypothetical protein INR76_09815 [Marixanthomonas sp. SCSIO 43207]|uniref:GNVR domain-containing protein n=1 Tax=Marixanthomonas sp. SCSIO 43207 TaxID=2779360 RepID=UPI001CA8D39B|nr:GNVR domain-containing protein [Marixanthomonas sp. SCSIO 43207]UAB80412.1 hypothetical protein INR76_09815 [Marixanthomonas sp. SCSIO 43207]